MVFLAIDSLSLWKAVACPEDIEGYQTMNGKRQWTFCEAVKLNVATKTIGGCLARADRLYEQEPGEAFAPSRLGKYVQRRIRWLYSRLVAETSPHL